MTIAGWRQAGVQRPALPLPPAADHGARDGVTVLRRLSFTVSRLSGPAVHVSSVIASLTRKGSDRLPTLPEQES
ncbi:MAG: hypothetical protein ACRECZ_07205, partial [Methylocella sp.]